MGNSKSNQKIKRWERIVGELNRYMPNDIASLVGEYTYDFEGKSYTLTKYPGMMICIAGLPCGRIITAADPKAKIWDPQTGHCVRTLETGYVQYIGALGESIGTISYDGSVRIWNQLTGKCENTFTDHSVALCFTSLACDRIIIGLSNGAIKIWNRLTGGSDHMFTGHTKGVTCIVVLSSNRMASGSYDGTIKIWNLLTGINERTLISGSVTAIRALVLFDELLISGEWGKIQAWNVSNWTNCYTLGVSSYSCVDWIGVLPDGQIVWKEESYERNFIETIKIGDLRTKKGYILQRSADHLYHSIFCTMLPGGQFAFGSAHTGIKMWE